MSRGRRSALSVPCIERQRSFTDHDPLRTWSAAWATEVRLACARALNEHLVSLVEAIRDLNQLIVLHACLHHPRGRFTVATHQFDYLIATLAAHGPIRYDQHVVLLVDGDGAGSGHARRQELVARVDADRHRIRDDALRQRASW